MERNSAFNRGITDTTLSIQDLHAPTQESQRTNETDKNDSNEISNPSSGDDSNGGSGNDSDRSRYEEAIQDGDLDGDIDDDSRPEILFKKKIIPKSRQQSLQSVLSSASLRSLSSQTPQPQVKQFNSGNSNNHNKNHQSFIQAPALAANAVKRQSVEIGQQLPFNNKSKESQHAEYRDSENEESVQQQRLTENALKRLNFSPLPIQNAEESNGNNHSTNTSEDHKPAPYQPAEVDLSSFVSLTRQPRNNQDTVSSVSTTSSGTASTVSTNTLKLNTSLAPSNNINNIMDGDIPLLQSNNTSPLLPRPMNDFSIPSPAATSRLGNRPVHWPSPQIQRPASQPQLPYQAKAQKKIKQVRTQEQTGILKSDIPSQIPRNDKTGSSKILNDINGSASVSQSISTNTLQIIGSNGNTSPINAVYSNRSKSNSPLFQQDHVQQIKDPRKPMYIPAVLRSFDSSVKQNKTSSQNSRNSKNSPNRSILSTYRDSLSSHTANWRMRITSDSTINHNPEPTRAHWVKDESTNICTFKNCKKEFNFFERRHHCRKCGYIFCNEHTLHSLNLNMEAHFTLGGQGTLCKVCDSCVEDYEDFVKKELGVDVENLSHRRDDLTNNFGSMTINGNMNIGDDKERQSSVVGDQTVGSVPADWSWSSF